ncbi:carbohydrate sulfotransferase 11-like [Amphiura filiformis]|uniref:carbohydrate sulfotransferase 11-like n=1 Tax=Amphiura filiformis TaxID=82378 RepID=UPI003B21437F
MRIQEAIQAARIQHLHNMCKKYHTAAPNPIEVAKSTKDILVNEKHKIAMCITAKIAGKSWKRVLNVLAGLSNSTLEDASWKAVIKARKIKRVRQVEPEELTRMLQEYTFVMFTRHPLSRTLSAFNNKMSPNATDYRNRKSFWRLGYEIIKEYRPWVSSLKNPDPKTYDLTIHDFVRFLIDQNHNRSRTDNHWIENYKFCHPCDFPYTVIGKYETLLEDAKYILKLTKVDDIVNFPESEGFAGNSTQSSELRKLMSFYHQIPIDDLQKLIKRYKLDYILFNYTLPTETGLQQWLGI